MKDDEEEEKTIQAEDFMKLQVSLKKNPDRRKEVPKTETPK
jgi:hypothetical protein